MPPTEAATKPSSVVHSVVSSDCERMLQSAISVVMTSTGPGST